MVSKFLFISFFRIHNLLEYKTILFIDDDQDEHLLIEEAILDKDEALLNFNFYFSARTALDHLESGLIRPELIVLDINMPLMTGIDFLRELKKTSRFNYIPVVMHSTTIDLKTRQVCEDLGAIAFLQKEYNHDLLFETIKMILNRSDR